MHVSNTCSNTLSSLFSSSRPQVKVGLMDTTLSDHTKRFEPYAVDPVSIFCSPFWTIKSNFVKWPQTRPEKNSNSNLALSLSRMHSLLRVSVIFTPVISSRFAASLRRALKWRSLSSGLTNALLNRPVFHYKHQTTVSRFTYLL